MFYNTEKQWRSSCIVFYIDNVVKHSDMYTYNQRVLQFVNLSRVCRKENILWKVIIPINYMN